MSIQQENDLIELLKGMNNGTKEVKEQLALAERRLRDLEYKEKRKRERKSFVRRIEQEVGQEKLKTFLIQNGLYHLCETFRKMTLSEFKRSDPIDWPPLGEADLRQLLFLR